MPRARGPGGPASTAYSGAREILPARSRTRLKCAGFRDDSNKKGGQAFQREARAFHLNQAGVANSIA